MANFTGTTSTSPDKTDRDREKGDRVLDYDGMIALLIKREGGVLEQARPRSNPERINSLNRRYGLIVKVSWNKVCRVTLALIHRLKSVVEIFMVSFVQPPLFSWFVRGRVGLHAWTPNFVTVVISLSLSLSLFSRVNSWLNPSVIALIPLFIFISREERWQGRS